MHPPFSATPTDPGSPKTGSDGRRLWRAGTLTYTTTGLVVLFGWLLWGDFGWWLKERSVTPVAQLLLKTFSASDMLIGVLVGSLPAALGMLLGPVISVRSDRHRGRWGRRIPYLLVPTPIAALAIAGLAFTPALGAWLHRWLGAASPGPDTSVLIAFGIFWTIFEIATVIANAVLGGLINDVVPPEIIGRFFGLFRAIALIAGIIFNFWIMGHVEDYYFWIFIGVGVIYGVGFSLMCVMVKEGTYPPPAPRSTGAAGGVMVGVKAYLRECFALRYYRWVFAAVTLGVLAYAPVNTFSVFYAKSVGLSMDAYGKYLAYSYGVSLVLSFFLGWLADKFHPLRVGIAAIAAYGCVALWAGFYATTAAGFAFAFVAHTILTGAYVTATASLGQRLYPAAQFAQFASAAGLVTALFSAVLPPLMGRILDLSGHAYRLTFVAGGILALVALAALLVVHREFVRLGGNGAYVAP